MKWEQKSRTKWILPVLIAALLLAAAMNLPRVLEVFSTLFSAITPIIVGLCIAIILNVPMRFFENKCYARAKNSFFIKLRRPLAFITTLLLVLGVLALALCVIIPELIHTTEVIITNLPVYAESCINWAQGILKSLGVPEETVNTLSMDWGLFVTRILEFLQTPTVANTATSFTTGLAGGIFNTVMALVIAIYTLLQKERIISFFKRLLLAILPANTTEKIFVFSRLSNTAFSGFIRGQFLDASILGALTYLGMLIFGFPYSAAVSIIIGVTSLIPIAGPIIGASLGAFLILMNSPLSALLFILFIVVLQQIEGNLIFPRIVGKSMGLPGVIVLSAVIIGSGLYGISGILIGVPLSAVLYTLTKEFITQRLSNTEQLQTPKN